MASKRAVSPLYAALETFGRRGRRLNAARLEAVPDVLYALFDRDALVADSERRRAHAAEVATALTHIVAGFVDPVDRRIAEVVLAARPEFYEKTVTARQEHVYEVDFGFTADQFKTRRARIVGDIAAELQRSVGRGAVPGLAALGPEVRRAARQLYWWLQDALLYVESFDHSARVIDNLVPGGEYQTKSRAIITARTVHSDAALWALTHCFDFLRTLQADDDGREFLRAHLPGSWWRRALNTPFTEYETAELRQVLRDSVAVEATPFVNAVLVAQHGSDLQGRWLRLLSTPPPHSAAPDFSDPRLYGKYRRDLADNLIALATALEPAFPSETRPPVEVGEASDIVVWGLTLWGATDQGMTFDDAEGHEIYRAKNKALRDGPRMWTARHVKAT